MRWLIVLVLVLLLFLVGCNTDTVERNEAYEKCTIACSSAIGDDYTTLHLCNENCKKEFLKEE